MLDWVAAVKAAQPVINAVGRVGVKQALKVLTPRRVVDAAYARARADGGRFGKKELRDAIKDGQVLQALLLNGGSLRPRAEAELRRLVYSDEAAARLLGFIVEAYVSFAPVVAANQAIADDTVRRITTVVLDDGSRTRAGLNAERSFEDNLATLHPLRREAARTLRARWSGVAQCVDALINAPDRAAVIEGWSEDAPVWMQGVPGDALTWLGQLAEDVGASARSRRRLIEAGLAAGASRRAYWLCRIAMIDETPVDQLRDLLRPVQEDLLASAILAIRDDQTDSAVAALDRWRPVAHDESALRAILLSRLLASTGDIDGAIALGDEAFEVHTSTTAGLASVELRLVRASRDGSVSPNSLDLQEAYARAIDIRDSRRTWHIESAPAVLLAARAARLLGNTELSRQLVNAESGEATRSEAEDAAVLAFAALLAAEIGLMHDMPRLRERVNVISVRLAMDAFGEVRRGNIPGAVELWERAIKETTDTQLKFEITQFLASHGVESSFLPTLRSMAAAAAEDISRIARLFSGDKRALVEVKSRANGSRSAALALVIHAERQRDPQKAGELAQKAALNWGDPDLWLRAGVNFLEAGLLDSALESAQGALASASGMWGGHQQGHRLLFQIQARLGDWERAASSASALIGFDRDDPDALWALLTAHAFSAEWDAAARVYREFGADSSPRTEDEAVLLLNLYQRFGGRVIALTSLTSEVRPWYENERIRGAAAIAVLLNGERTEDEAELVRRIILDFLHDFPGTRVLVQVSVDPEQPLQALQELFADAPDLSELEKLAGRGGLPVGFVSEVRPVPYSEAIVTRVTGARFVGGSNAAVATQAIENAIDNGSVIDSTAVFTLALLEGRGSLELRSIIDLITGSREQQRDSTQGVESMKQASTLTFKPRAGGVHAITEDALEQRRTDASRLREAFRTISTVPTVALPAVFADDRLGKRTPWLSAITLAKSSNSSLWVDDLALRQIAIGEGIPAFSSFDLIDFARRSEREGSALMDSAAAWLLLNGYAGYPFRVEVFDTASALAAGNPELLWPAFRFGGESEDVNAKLGFLLKLMGEAAEDPEVLRAWATIASRWLIEIAGADVAAHSNVVAMLNRILAEQWVSATTIPFVLAGVHDAMAAVDFKSDAVFDAFRSRFAFLAPRMGYSAASAHLRLLGGHVNDEDRQAVTRAILSID